MLTNLFNNVLRSRSCSSTNRKKRGSLVMEVESAKWHINPLSVETCASPTQDPKGGGSQTDKPAEKPVDRRVSTERASRPAHRATECMQESSTAHPSTPTSRSAVTSDINTHSKCTSTYAINGARGSEHTTNRDHIGNLEKATRTLNHQVQESSKLPVSTEGQRIVERSYKRYTSHYYFLIRGFLNLRVFQTKQ